MRLHLTFLLVACGMAFAGNAMAEKVNCKEAMAQQDLNFCAAQEYTAADKELNAVWTKARAHAKSLDAGYDKPMQGADEALLAGQRGWIAYRDGQCELSGWEAHGGSMEPMLVAGCMTDMTRARTKELRDFIDARGTR